MKEEKVKTYEIYCATNKINGKCYVGQTSEGLHERKRKHILNAKYHYKRDHSAIQYAIHKYGQEAFEWCVIETHTTLEDCNEAEEFFIAYLNTLAPNGYNIQRGGNNHMVAESTKLKISQKLKLTSNLIGLSGKDHPAYGKIAWNKGLYMPDHLPSNVKLDARQARLIYEEYIDGYSLTELQLKYSLNSKSTILNILNKKCWKKYTQDLPEVDTSRGNKGSERFNSKLDEQQVLEIYNKYYAMPMTITHNMRLKALREEYQVSGSIIINIIIGRNWKHITNHDDNSATPAPKKIFRSRK